MAKAFVLFSAALFVCLLVLFVGTAFFDLGPISQLARSLFGIAAVIAVVVVVMLFWARWLPRELRQQEEFGDGPLKNTLDATQSVLEAERRKGGGDRT